MAKGTAENKSFKPFLSLFVQNYGKNKMRVAAVADPVSKDELNELGRDVTARLEAAGQNGADPETLRKDYGALLKRYDDFKAAGVKPFVSMDQNAGTQNATDFGNLGYIIRDLDKKIKALPPAAPKADAETIEAPADQAAAAMEETRRANLANIQAETARLQAQTEEKLTQWEADTKAAEAAAAVAEAEKQREMEALALATKETFEIDQPASVLKAVFDGKVTPETLNRGISTLNEIHSQMHHLSMEAMHHETHLEAIPILQQNYVEAHKEVERVEAAYKAIDEKIRANPERYPELHAKLLNPYGEAAPMNDEEKALVQERMDLHGQRMEAEHAADQAYEFLRTSRDRVESAAARLEKSDIYDAPDNQTRAQLHSLMDRAMSMADPKDRAAAYVELANVFVVGLFAMGKNDQYRA